MTCMTCCGAGREKTVHWTVSPQNHPPDNLVSAALERKADEPFATQRLVTHTPAVWILNLRVRDTK